MGIHSSSDRSNSTVVANATVRPGETEELVIGLYEKTIPEPKLSLELEAIEESNIETVLLRRETEGDYTLSYQMTNKGSHPLQVIVRSLEPDYANL